MLELAMKLGDWLREVAQPQDEFGEPSQGEGRDA